MYVYYITSPTVHHARITIDVGVIHIPLGQIFGHFDPPPPSWSLLLNKAYVIKWSFGQPPLPPPQLSTWFMDAPLVGSVLGQKGIED